MKKTIVLTIILALYVVSVFGAETARAVGFATNTIILYEGTQRIRTNSIFHNRDRQSPVCKDGICYVGQQYDSVTVYQTNESNILSYDEWIDTWYISHPGCEGFAENKDEIRQALEEWRNSDRVLEIQKRVEEISNVDERKRLWDTLEPEKSAFMKQRGFESFDNPECKTINLSDYQNVYLQQLIDEASYSKTIDLPSPEGVQDCQGEVCFGGKIGSNRVLEVDIKSGEIVAQKQIRFNLITEFAELVRCYFTRLFGNSC